MSNELSQRPIDKKLERITFSLCFTESAFLKTTQKTVSNVYVERIQQYHQLPLQGLEK